MTDKPPVLIKAIAAMDKNRAIGYKNALPWNVPEDMKYFVKNTKGHTVLMGRKTFESAPMNSKPLPQRKNLIVTRDTTPYTNSENVEYLSKPIEYIKDARSGKRAIQGEILWIIGGAEIYQLTAPQWDEVYLTHIKGEFEGDTFFPKFESAFALIAEQDIGPCRFLHYKRT